MAATHVFVNGVPLARGKFDLWMEGGGPQLVVDVTRPILAALGYSRLLSAALGCSRLALAALARQSPR